MDNYEQFEYVDDSKKKSKKSLILFIIIFLLIIAATISVFYFADIDLPWSTPKLEEEDDNSFEKDLELQNKTYNKETDLIVPTFQYTTIYQRNDLAVDISKLTANQDGYVFSITATNKSEYQQRLNCEMILIDGFQLEENFDFTLNSNESLTQEITIPKTELAHYEIRDFNKLTFLGKLYYRGKEINVNFNAETQQLSEVDNKKEGLLIISKVKNLAIYYYKKVEDNNNYYLYFDIKNNNDDNYNIFVKSLLLEDTNYNPEKINIYSYHQGEKIFYIKIPKNVAKSFKDFSISFFVIKDYKASTQEINITDLTKFSL